MPEPKEEQRLVEIIVSGLSRDALDTLVVDVAELMAERWPQFGPAVAARYSLDRHPHQDVEREDETLRVLAMDLDTLMLALSVTPSVSGTCSLPVSTLHPIVEHTQAGLKVVGRAIDRLREREAEVERQRQNTFDAQVVIPELQEDVERLRETLREIIQCADSATEREKGRSKTQQGDALFGIGQLARAALRLLDRPTDKRLERSQFPTPQTQAMRDAVEAAQPPDLLTSTRKQDLSVDGAVSDLAAALQIAIKVHAGQTDKQGEPYLLHVLRVVEAVGEEAKVVAALHDVLEDDDPGVEALATVRLSETKWQALALLTRDKQEDYAHYIAQIASEDAGTWTHQKGVLLAREVKLADLRDNLGRIPAQPTINHAASTQREWAKDWKPLKARYEKAIATLSANVELGEEPNGGH